MTTKPPKAYEGKEKYIFISYAHKDKEKVWPIIEKLNNAGYRVWYDDGIDPGSEWAKTIAEHLHSCHVFVSMMSDNYLASQNCTDEMHYSRELKKKSLLVYLSDIQMPPDLQMRFGMRQAIHKYKYYKEDEFYLKFYKSEGFEECKEPTSEPSEGAPTRTIVGYDGFTITIRKGKKLKNNYFTKIPNASQEPVSSEPAKERKPKTVVGIIFTCLIGLFILIVLYFNGCLMTTNLIINDGETLTMGLGETIPLSDLKFEGDGFTEEDKEDIKDNMCGSSSDWVAYVVDGEIIATSDPGELAYEYDDGTAYDTTNIRVLVFNESGKWKGKLNVEVRE